MLLCVWSLYGLVTSFVNEDVCGSTGTTRMGESLTLSSSTALPRVRGQYPQTSASGVALTSHLTLPLAPTPTPNPNPNQKKKKYTRAASTPDVVSGGPPWSGLYGPVLWLILFINLAARSWKECSERIFSGCPYGDTTTRVSGPWSTTEQAEGQKTCTCTCTCAWP